MIKKSISLLIAALFIFTTIGMCKNLDQPTAKPYESTKDRVSRGMNNLFLGPVEVPKNLDESKTKGTPVEGCSTMTRSGVERGIARIVGGVWQIATFWYSDPGCVTSSSPAPAIAASAATTTAPAESAPAEMK